MIARLTLVPLLAAGIALSVAPAAQAKRTYCQKWAAADPDKPKVVKKTGGITVYRASRTYSACSDALKKGYALTIADDGQTAKTIVTARKRCLAILFSGGTSPPEILIRDLGAKSRSSAVRTVGYGTTGAAVGALKMATNCSLAWSEVVEGAVTVYGRGIAPFSAIPEGTSTVAGTAATIAEARSVTIRAAGKGATIGWLSGGVAQSKTLP